MTASFASVTHCHSACTEVAQTLTNPAGKFLTERDNSATNCMVVEESTHADELSGVPAESDEYQLLFGLCKEPLLLHPPSFNPCRNITRHSYVNLPMMHGCRKGCLPMAQCCHAALSIVSAKTAERACPGGGPIPRLQPSWHWFIVIPGPTHLLIFYVSCWEATP